MTLFAIRHRTAYQYAKAVELAEHRLMFRPRDSYDQHLLEATLVVTPAPRTVRWIHDVFGNCVAIVNFNAKTRELIFESNIRINHTPLHSPDFQIDAAAVDYPFPYADSDLPDLASTLRRHYADPNDEIGHWARQFVVAGRSNQTGTVLMTLCCAIQESFGYRRRLEAGTQTPLQTLQSRHGSCRDFAVLMIEAARSLGFAARFVTGYIYVADRDGAPNLGGGSTHAWCQVYVPSAGWVEFDPTNGIVGSRDLIRVAVARTPAQAIPLSGSYVGTSSDSSGMKIQVNVTTEPNLQGDNLHGASLARPGMQVAPIGSVT
jgi:transglutaminase-like putative cysteine protease